VGAGVVVGIGVVVVGIGVVVIIIVVIPGVVITGTLVIIGVVIIAVVIVGVLGEPGVFFLVRKYTATAISTSPIIINGKFLLPSAPKEDFLGIFFLMKHTFIFF
jgi:hypothetical protein